MEWVETTARTVEEAVEAALDQLGVAEDDADIEVLEEPKAGLFGRVRGEARVRVRVRPTKPRAKEDRRDRRRRARSEGGDEAAPAEGAVGSASAGSAPQGDLAGPDGDRSEGTAPSGRRGSETSGAAARPPRGRGRSDTPEHSREEDAVSDDGRDEDYRLDEQAAVAEEFLLGLTETFGLAAEASRRELSPDTVEVALSGQDLGYLIGPRGATLTAVQDLARTVVQRRTGARIGRLMVDVGGYRQRRHEALERFVRQLAEEVRASGERRVLEPMSSSDRKVVHDTVNDIDGVVTSSHGEDPRRYVVIDPA